MNSLRCPRCHGSLPLPEDPPAPELSGFCRSCQREVTHHIFPAALRPAAASPAATLAVDGGSVCFHCPTRNAVASCENCGCYLCAGCQTSWFGKTLCLNCIHAHREIRGSAEFKSRAVLWDNISLVALTAPLFLIPLYGLCLSLIIAPGAIYVVIRHRRERGLVPRGPWRMISVLVLSVLLLGGLVLLIAQFALLFDPSPSPTGPSGTIGAAPAGEEESTGDQAGKEPAKP